MSLNSIANTSLAEACIEFEAGILDEQETVEFFQDLIDSGQAWRMAGHYGRTAMLMISDGKCLLGPTGHHDAYGNYFPSRDEVQPGVPGSPDFVLNNLAA